MDPTVCTNPTFKNPGPNPNPNTRDLSSDVSKKLEEAVKRLKNELEEAEFESPHPVIEIKGHKNQCLVVKEITSTSESELRKLVIYRNTDSEDSPLFEIDTDKFHHVQFSSLEDCRVFVLTKTVRVFFMRCNNCQISVRRPLISALELFKCKNLQLSIRIESEDTPIPLILIEDCSKVDIYQSNRELVYIIKVCIDITGNIIDPVTKERLSKYNLGKIFWGEQERSFVLLSRTQGFATVSDTYQLNSLEHNLMIRQLDSENEESDDQIEDLFGTTPPIAQESFMKRRR